MYHKFVVHCFPSMHAQGMLAQLIFILLLWLTIDVVISPDHTHPPCLHVCPWRTLRSWCFNVVELRTTSGTLGGWEIDYTTLFIVRGLLHTYNFYIYTVAPLIHAWLYTNYNCYYMYNDHNIPQSLQKWIFSITYNFTNISTTKKIIYTCSMFSVTDDVIVTSWLAWQWAWLQRHPPPSIDW